MASRLGGLLVSLLFALFAAMLATITLSLIVSCTPLAPWIADHAPYAGPVLFAVFAGLAVGLTRERAAPRRKSLGRRTGRSLRHLQDAEVSSSGVNSRPRF